MTASQNSKAIEIPSHVPPGCIVNWDFNDVPGAESDVHLAWKKLQDGPPIQWTPHYGGHWIATRQALIKEIQTDHLHFSHKIFSLPRVEGMRIPPLDTDPPEHTQMRRVISIAFSPKVIGALKDEARALAIELTEGLVKKGRCDFVSDYAQKYPVTVFLKMVDLPIEKREIFLEWAEVLVRGRHEDKVVVFSSIAEYLGEVVKTRYEYPGVDVISQIATSKIDNRRISFEECYGMSTLLFLGGLDTVASMMGFFMRFLATHPGHRQQLVSAPEKIPNAVNELLRRHGLSNTVRLIVEDYDFHGVSLKQGELIMVPISLAGLDESRWENPLEVDFSRNSKEIDTFGNGPHRCAGASLARLELGIFLEEWLRRIPDFRVPQGSLVKTASGAVNGVLELPLEWDVPV